MYSGNRFKAFITHLLIFNIILYMLNNRYLTVLIALLLSFLVAWMYKNLLKIAEKKPDR